MLRNLVRSSLKFRVLVVAAAAGLLVLGGSQLHKAPVEVLPDFTPTTVEVQTEALGLSAAEVEQLVTVPLEQDLLNGVAFLKDIRSQSVPGLSRILMIFEPGTGIFRARQLVAERLTQAHALPQVSKPPLMLQPLSSTDRVLLVGMSSKTLSLLQMGVLARWTIAPRLVGVPGVSNVAVWGQEDQQLQVQVDPERLARQRVRLGQVIETSANALWVSPLTYVEASTPGTGGFVDTANQRLGVQHESPISTARDLAKVRLEGTGDRKLVLGDVADVIENHQPLIGDAVLTSAPGLLLVVQRSPGAHLLGVTRGVEKAINEMRPGLSGITFDTNVFRPASYVEASIDNVKRVVFIGLAILGLLLLASFFGWRAAVICLVVVPLSMLVAVLVLWAFGTTFNVIVLAGLGAAVLLLIDDAIVSIDHTMRRIREERRKGVSTPPAETFVAATLEMRRPLLYATSIIALATLPLFFLNRLAGAFFPDLLSAFLLALLASTAVALVVTPALSVVLFSRAPLDDAWPRPLVRLRAWYEAALARLLRRPRPAYVATAVLLALGAASAPFLRQSLLPTLKENDVLVSWSGPPGTSLPEMNRVTARASRELRALPGVSDVGAHVGRAVTGDQVVGVNSAEIWVGIDRRANYDATLNSIRRVVAAYPGFSHDVGTYSQQRVGDSFSGAGDDLVVRVYGEDLGVLRRQGTRVRRTISAIGGVTGARVLLPTEEPTLQVRVDLARADRYGVKPGDVRRAATTLVSGLVVGNLFQQQKVFDVVVWGAPKTRNGLSSIRNLLIDTPEGGHVRLRQVANVSIAPSPGVINRQAVSRYVDVGATVSGRDRDAVVADVERTLAALQLPLEYHATVLAAETQRTPLLVSIAIAAAIGMFLLLQALFASWRLAALALASLPVGVVGGIAGALAVGGRLSFGSYIALFAVVGLATRVCVLLFERIRQLERDEPVASGPEVVGRAAGERFQPILMTSLAGLLVSLPVLILGSRPGLEALQPIAGVFVGGLTSLLVFSTLVLPTLYLRFGFRAAVVSEEAGDDLFPVLAGLGTAAAQRGEGITATEAKAVRDPGSGGRP
jgi:Cu/Ag efflux pump CusA